MAKEGYGFVVTFVFISLCLSLGAWYTGKPYLLIMTIISWLFVGFSCYFFRDPERTIPTENNIVLSAGDGKVIAIEKEFEPLFFKKEVTRISIFLSVFNVHINRIPLDGEVTYFDYKRGKFLPAFNNDASYENEQSIIGIENDRCKILFKQIAGIIARRIVCNIREGNKVTKGERFGIIKFGSRVDMFIPANVKIKVKLNDRVTGGETIIGQIDE